MAIQAIEEEEWLRLSRIGPGWDAVLFTTPLCGTCKVAERMLEVADAAGESATLYRINLNFAPVLRERWQIESVPCLALVHQGKLMRKEYAMRSVDYLHRMLRELP
ncbi:thioredoxin family protein [Paenibacillus aurantiacus]|uniref:Thioredoxin family protein n=1 Tax=Paenibacillus aurantiacus TaxID=1936118 RepID=A0ABV5KIM6_9BACL